MHKPKDLESPGFSRGGAIKTLLQDLKHAIQVALDAWKYRRHLRAGGNPDYF